jgi:hypothetical protein
VSTNKAPAPAIPSRKSEAVESQAPSIPSKTKSPTSSRAMNNDVDSIEVLGRFEFHTLLPPPPNFKNVPKVFSSSKNSEKVTGPRQLASMKTSNRSICIPTATSTEKTVASRGPAPAPRAPVVSAAAPSPSPTPSAPPKTVGAKPPPPSRGTPPAVSASSAAGGGGDDIDSQIAAAKAEMQAAVSSMQFEKCAALRDKISSLEAKKAAGDGGTSTIVWDQSRVTNGLADINKKMEDATKNLQFEKCVTYREVIKILKDGKGNFDRAASASEKQSVLNQIDEAVANALAL